MCRKRPAYRQGLELWRKPYHFNLLVPEERLELSWVAPLAPKASVSTIPPSRRIYPCLPAGRNSTTCP